MDLLDPSALIETLPTLLPPPSEGDEDSSRLRHPYDALAAMLHTIMHRLDFRLVGLSEEARLPEQEDGEGQVRNRLPKAWNAKGPDGYTFRYKHDQSSLDFLLRPVRMAGRVLVHAIALQVSDSFLCLSIALASRRDLERGEGKRKRVPEYGADAYLASRACGINPQDNKTATLDLPIGDYFSPSFFPYPSSTSGSGASRSSEPLVNGFISSSRLSDLVVAFKTQIVQKLIPGLRKDGYEESAGTETTGQSSSSSRDTRESRAPPSDPQSRVPRPPFFDDAEDPTFPGPMGGRNPLIIGDRDLDPLGGGPLAMPPRFGGGSFGPPPLFPGGQPGRDPGGGMFVGPDHPMFRDRFQNPSGPGPGGPWGGDGYLPPGGAPPGARFDPITPFGPAGGGRGGGVAMGRGRGGGAFGGRGGRASGEPDFDELLPPGNVSARRRRRSRRRRRRRQSFPR